MSTGIQKLRRRSGRVTPDFAVKGKYSELIEDCLEPQAVWDDWQDYREGMRNPKDKTKIRKIPKNSFLGRYFDVERWNKKIRKLVERRRASKWKVLGAKQFEGDFFGKAS